MGGLSNLYASSGQTLVGGSVITETYVLELAATNLFLYSSTFSNAAWLNTNVTVTNNTTFAPNGVVEADTLTSTAAGANQLVQAPVIPVTALDYTFSVYLLAGTSTSVQIGMNVSGYSFTNFNPITGQITFTSGDAVAAVESIVINGAAWYRVTLTKNNLFGGALAQGFVMPDQLAIGGKTVIAWGAQMEQADEATSPIPTSAAQVTRAAGIIPPWLVMGAGGALPVPTNNGVILIATALGTWTTTTARYPSLATVPGKFLRADGVDWAATTAAYPNTAASAGKIIRADGTNYVESQSTYPDLVAAGNVLHATAANTVGSANAFTYSGGRLQNTTQPAFLAYKSAITPNTTGDGTAYNILCDAERFDLASNYNTGTGEFTAPSNGTYRFETSALLTGFDLSYTVASLIIRTSNAVYYWESNIQLTGQQNFFTSVLADMDAGDTAYVTIAISTSAKTITTYGNGTVAYTRFSGNLVT